MSGEEHKYFNFPVVLLEGFLKDSISCLNNIYDYALFTHTLNYECGNEVEKITSADKYFKTVTGNKEQTFSNGMELYNSIPKKMPMVGINVGVWFDFYKHDKDDFQLVSLLGFLAIKSILQNKAYCKIDNKFWLSRMDGKARSVNSLNQLSRSIKIFANEYQTKKIKNELIYNWGLKHYSRYTRGFYVSFSLDLDQLVYEAEKRRKSTKEKERKFSERLAVERALVRLNSEHDHNTTITRPIKKSL